MIEIAYDFHIHSALSPCAEMEMTPNSIVGMAAVKGLDAIAITDHNSIENVSASMAVGEKYGVLVVPGIEVQTKEDVHVLCLFPTYDALAAFYSELESYRLYIKHQPEKFGRQVVFSEDDEEVCEMEHSLFFSYTIGLTPLLQLVNSHNGAFVPAHVDRNSFSIISNLGFVPFDLSLKTVEYAAQCDIQAFQNNHKQLKLLSYIVDSDAHQLVDINEADHKLQVASLSAEAIIEKLKRG